MGIKLSVGLQKKVGLPDYGSLGASCYVEFEIDHSLLDSNLEGFHQKVSGAFAACQQAVNEQLALQQSERVSVSDNRRTSDGPAVNPAVNPEPRRPGEPGTATSNQVRAIFAIARRQQVDALSLVRERFGIADVEGLSRRDASTLIDELQGRATELVF